MPGRVSIWADVEFPEIYIDADTFTEHQRRLLQGALNDGSATVHELLAAAREHRPLRDR